MPSPEIADAVGRLLRADPARTLALARGLRASNRSLESTVKGGSMGPRLGPGSRIRIALVHRDHYETGEVVAYLAGNQVVVHRVVHRGKAAAAGGYFITRGDATLVPDSPVDRDRILGPVSGVWRDGAWVPPDGPPRRSLCARVARALSLAMAVAVLYLSPRLTARALTGLHGAVGVLRGALARGGRPAVSGPPPESL